MAESVLFGFASNVLSTIATGAFKSAYESVISTTDARDELAKLERSIQMIQSVLLDAEKRQHRSKSIKLWVKEVNDVLHDADDLFDEVNTDDMLKRLSNGGEKPLWLSDEVWDSIFSNSIDKKVKAIRERLDKISEDMTSFQFAFKCEITQISPDSMRGREQRYYVDAKDVIGRDEDKKLILEMLFNESSHAQQNVPLVIAIVGIGGMGKTSLGLLFCNDIEVKKKFDECWFACISKTSDEKEIRGKIYQAICGGKYIDLTPREIDSGIKKGIEDKKFLLVLDDVWDDSNARWKNLLSLLGGNAESRIIITTRLSSVASLCMDKSKVHTLGGLSDDDSWKLFKGIAFSPEHEKDQERNALGKEIMKKCRNVPLAIRTIADLLFKRNTISEWRSIKEQKLGDNDDDDIFPILKLSFDHLSSELKKCFAYCSLFPEDYVFKKDKLIWFWIAQGYIRSNDIKIGHSYFMYLLRSGFFQEAKEDIHGEIESCKMHDLIRELALRVAGDEIVMLPTSSDIGNCTRHVSVDACPDDSWGIPTSLVKANKLRSFLFMYGGAICKPVLDELFENFKLMRTLGLSRLRLNEIPSCIGDLKHLRYLDLSNNHFKSVPDSMTNLVNLLVLNLGSCWNLKKLPDNFRNLINLRYLDISDTKVMHMPPEIEELTCLEYLSHFVIGKANEGVECSGIEVLSRMQQLRGELDIYYFCKKEIWNGYDSWELPVFVNQLEIWNYPGIRIPQWSKNVPSDPNFKVNLVSLTLRNSYHVKYLPPLRYLPNLKFLKLTILENLEYVEEEEESSNASTSTFFPRLETLQLFSLPNLKGWRREAASEAEEHPLPLDLFISTCEKLTSLPLSLSSRIQKLQVELMPGETIQDILSIFPSLQRLETMSIIECKYLRSVHLHDEALPSLRVLQVCFCHRLKVLEIAPRNSIEELVIGKCEQLELWEQDEYKELRRELRIENRERLRIENRERLRIENRERLRLQNHQSLPRRLQLWEQDDDEAPSEQDDEEAPSEQDDEEAPSEQDDDEAPSEQDDEEAPSEQDDDEAPSEQDDEEAPSEQDDDEAPSEQDDEEAPLFNWDSLPELRQLRSEYIPPPEKLPERLQRRHADGILKIIDPTGGINGIYPGKWDFGM